MSNRKVDAILLDLDGTLIDSFPALFRAYAKFLLMQGKVATEEEFFALNGIPVFDILQILKDKHNLHLPVEDLQSIYRHFIEEEYLDTSLMSGALTFLEWAKERGITLGLVTSSRGEWVKPILERNGISDYFSSIVTRERVKHGKPHPEPFLLALKELAVDPEKTYAIDDAELGIESAKKAGLKTFLFVPKPPYPMDGGDWPTLKAHFNHLLQ